MFIVKANKYMRMLAFVIIAMVGGGLLSSLFLKIAISSGNFTLWMAIWILCVSLWVSFSGYITLGYKGGKK